MDLNLNNVTFIIVTYNSEQVINNCLDSLPKEASKIIIENSNNIETKNYLEKKYDNIKVFLSENEGMGSSNNKGIDKRTAEQKALKILKSVKMSHRISHFPDQLSGGESRG